MNISPSNQSELFCLDDEINQLIELYKKKELPNKILLTGQKGVGKCTLAYHLVNYILSQNENFSYDIKKHIINKENKSFKLIINKSSPNFNLIDINEKKKIDIEQIRELINLINKSSFNDKPRFVLIDNIEYLSTSSINALLKVIEEPTTNTFFILIHNNKKILSTLKSRCLLFKISLSYKKSIEILNKLLGENYENKINIELINYYFTPGNVLKLIKFSNENKIDLSTLNINQCLELFIEKNLFKKDSEIKDFIFELIEYYFTKNISRSNDKLEKFYYDFLNKINNAKKFNLDEQSLFMEFRYKILNG